MLIARSEYQANTRQIPVSYQVHTKNARLSLMLQEKETIHRSLE